MKKTNIIFLLFLSLLFFSCSKNDNDNQDRFEGTMEAKINGELIIFERATGDGSFNMTEDCIEDFHMVRGAIGFDNSSPEGHLINLYFRPSQGLGIYQPNATYITYSDWYDQSVTLISTGYNQYHFCVETQTHTLEEGSVTITSTENERYKGTFYFTAVRSCDATVVITEGKFEIPQKLKMSCD